MLNDIGMIYWNDGISMYMAVHSRLGCQLSLELDGRLCFAYRYLDQRQMIPKKTVYSHTFTPRSKLASTHLTFEDPSLQWS